MIKINEREDRLKKLTELKKIGINPYPAKTLRNYPIKQVLADFKSLEKQSSELR